MARLARLVVPGLPHHVTQRGNRREQVFFTESDYLFYRELPPPSPKRLQQAFEIFRHWCFKAAMLARYGMFEAKQGCVQRLAVEGLDG